METRNWVKRILSLFLALTLTVVAMPKIVKAAGNVVFTVRTSKTELGRGDEVTVSVDMSGNETATAITVKLNYDPNQLETSIDKIVAGDAFEGAIFSPEDAIGNSTPGQISATIAKSSYNDPIKNGNIFKATFKVKDTAKGTVAMELVPEEVIEFDENYQESFLTSSVQNINPQMQVIVPVTGIKLNKEKMTLDKGSSEQLTAILEPADASATVTWSSNNENVATVDGRGNVTAGGKGSAVITAEAGGKTATCSVTVNVPLKDISIQAPTTNIKKGQTVQLSVIYDPEDTTDNKTVVWKSTNNFATVDQNGLVTAVKDGVETITATIGNKTATINITVQEIKLQSIAIKETTTIHKGETETLEVIFNPQNTTDDKTVKWLSSDTTRATVDGSGQITAVAPGQAKITAQVGNFTDECVVTVDAPLKSIEVKEKEFNMIKNQTGQIQYTLNPVDTTYTGAISFMSNDNTVATVDANGVVTAKREGKTVITLGSADGITAQVTINIKEIPIDSIMLDALNKTIEVGESSMLTAIIGPDNTTDDDKTVTWSSSDDKIVSVMADAQDSSKATLKANKGGTAVITAATANGKTTQCTVFVPIHMTGITLPKTAELLRGSTKILELTCMPEEHDDDASVIWTSSDSDVAAVDADTGMIHAMKEGTAVITAKTKVVTDLGGEPFTAQTTVTIKENHLTDTLAEQIEFDKQLNLYISQTMNLTQRLNLGEIVKNNQITDDIVIKWESSKPEIMSIDQTGNVLGVQEGKTTVTAEITATDASGNKKIYVVSNTMDIKPLEGIVFNKVITEMVVGATEELKVISEPDGIDGLDVEWQSSDSEVISVDGGILKALKSGEATITAKVGGKEISCTIMVKDKADGKIEENQQKLNNQSKDSDNSIVKTGDTTNQGVYIVLMISMLAVIMLTLTMKRINRKR